jgi:glucose 1-dehydrogenase
MAFGVLTTLAANGIPILSHVPAIEDPVPADLSRWMCDLVLKNQVIFGTVNAGLSSYQDQSIVSNSPWPLFPSAVRSLICRVLFEQAPTVLARGRDIKDLVRMAA